MKKKHKITLLVIGILLALSLMLSSSYALWVFNVSQESTNIVNSDCFEITFSDSNPITLQSSFPITDTQTSKIKPYEFTISNVCNHAMDYSINLETLNTSTLDPSNIRARLSSTTAVSYGDNNLVEPLLSNASSAIKLKEDILAPNTTKVFKLKIWIKEDAISSEIENKTYASKVTVRGTLRKKYSEGILIDGSSVNVAFKELAGNENITGSTADVKVKNFERSTEEPLEEDNARDLSVEGSDNPVYFWFKDDTLYWYSKNDKVFLNSDASDMFIRMQGLSEIDLTGFDTSRVTNMENMFYGCREERVNLSNWDTYNVTNMRNLFGYSTNLKELDLSNFDTSNVTDMMEMFYWDSSLETLNISDFNTSKVTNMIRMFYQDYELKKLDVSNFDTSNVTNMSHMFTELRSVDGLDLSSFDTSKITDMNQFFYRLRNAKYLILGDKFDTSNVTDMSYMFEEMLSVKELDVSRFNTSKVTNMSHMFNHVTSVKHLDVSGFDTSNVTSMTYMFNNVRDLESLDVSNFNVSKVSSLMDTFSSMSNIKVLDLSNWNTTSITNFEWAFTANANLEILDISGIKSPNIYSLTQTFSNCPKLKTIYVSESWNQATISSSVNTFKNSIALVGGAGTTYDPSHIDKEYARIDDPDNGKPGYFTLKTN